MQSCWDAQPQQRPSFTDLKHKLTDLMNEDIGYLCLEGGEDSGDDGDDDVKNALNALEMEGQKDRLIATSIV